MTEFDDGANFAVINKAYSFFRQNPLPINHAKWPDVSFSDVRDKVMRLNAILQPPSDISINKVARNLFFIRPK